MGITDEQVCEQRHKTIDERCQREQRDMEKLEARQKETEDRSRRLEELNIKMGEILKNHEEKLTGHDRRIVQLESVSAARWNSVVNYLLAGASGALVSAAAKMITGG